MGQYLYEPGIGLSRARGRTLRILRKSSSGFQSLQLMLHTYNVTAPLAHQRIKHFRRAESGLEFSAQAYGDKNPQTVCGTIS